MTDKGPKPLTPGRIAKLLKNPGTRAALQDKYLTPAQLKQRQLNQRLDTPVTPGSSMTNRQLARSSKAAANVYFGGDPVAQAQQLQKDTGGWYAQYQAAANQLKTDLGNNATQATNASTNLTNAVGQLGAATAVGDGAVRDDATKAATVRQALSSGFGTMLAAQGQNSRDYGAKIADLVVPGETLTALNKAAGRVGDARQRVGAYETKYRNDAIDSEGKNVLASSVALGKDAAAQTAADNAAGAEGRKYGFTPSEWLALSPDRRTKIVAASKPDTSSTHYGPGSPIQNKFGYSYDEWTALSAAEKNKARAGKGKAGASGKAGKPNSGRGWAPGSEQGSAADAIGAALKPAQQLKASGKSRKVAGDYLTTGVGAQPVFKTVTTKGSNGKVTSKQVRVLNPDGTPKTTGSIAQVDPVWASIALDIAYDGHISRNNVRRLHARGIRVGDLGYPTKAPAVRPAANSPSERPKGGT